MKEKQGIRWSASGQAPENSVRSIRSIIAEAILDAVTVLMFLLSARAILYDVFRWGHFSVSSCIWIMFAVIAVSLVMGFSERWQRKSGRVVRGLVLLGGLFGFLSHYFFTTSNGVIISSGIREMFSQFIDLWNTYYATDVLVPGGIARNISAALEFYLLLSGFVLFWVAKISDKKVVVGILPAAAFIAELLVGYAPKITGLLFFGFAVILINVPQFKLPEFNLFPGKKRSVGKSRIFSWLPVLLVAVLVSSVLVNIASPYANKIIANSGIIRETIQKWIGEPKGMTSDYPFDSQKDNFSERLSNVTPAYKHVAVITITMERVAQGDIYLKEFYAGKYDDGRWDADIKSFEDYFKSKGISPERVSKEVVKREAIALARNYGVQDLGQSVFGKAMDIYYLAHYTGRTAVPYFADVSDNERMQIAGEGYYIRTGDVSVLSTDVWYYENQYEDFLSLFENEESPLIDWGYDDYVWQNYLEVPDGLDTVKSLAVSICSNNLQNAASSENELRLYKAALVREWMNKNTTYSLQLPELPQGIDAIEYFVGESRMGYCMHYASASVMLLREMGVPARLATGYVVYKGDFLRVSSGYSAQVKDDRAHAWVEIYLDGLGWFPVEVTKGYGNSTPNIPPQNESTQENTEGTDPTIDGTSEEETTSPDLTYEEDTTKSSEENTQGQNENESTTQGGNDGHEGGMDPEKLRLIIRRVLLIVGSVLLTMVAIVIVIKLRHEYQAELRRLIRRKKTSLAIRMMNRRIYRKLRMTGKIIRFNLRDDSYEEILKKHYTEISAEEWERYMELVKAASFSKREFSDEEVNFCYEIYRKVKPHS